jgi:hypothetical protein
LYFKSYEENIDKIKFDKTNGGTENASSSVSSNQPKFPQNKIPEANPTALKERKHAITLQWQLQEE